MTKIIDFKKITKSKDEGEWLFNLSVYAHGAETSCFITDTANKFEGMNRGSATRIISDRLDDLSFLMKQWAENYDKSDIGKPLIVVTIFEGGVVRLRTDIEMIVTDEQRSWARDQIVLAAKDLVLNEQHIGQKFNAWWEKSE